MTELRSFSHEDAETRKRLFISDTYVLARVFKKKFSSESQTQQKNSHISSSEHEDVCLLAKQQTASQPSPAVRQGQPGCSGESQQVKSAALHDQKTIKL